MWVIWHDLNAKHLLKGLWRCRRYDTLYIALKIHCNYSAIH